MTMTKRPGLRQAGPPPRRAGIARPGHATPQQAGALHQPFRTAPPTRFPGCSALRWRNSLASNGSSRNKAARHVGMMRAQSAPDGYTLGLGGIASHAIAPTPSPMLPPFNPRTDFTFVSTIWFLPNMLVVTLDLPVGTRRS